MRGPAHEACADPWVPFMTRSRSLLSRIIHRDPEEQCWAPWSDDGQCRAFIELRISLHNSRVVTLLNKSQHRENPRCMKEFCDAPLSCFIVFSQPGMWWWSLCVLCGQEESSVNWQLTNQRQVRWQHWPIRGELVRGILTAFDNSSLASLISNNDPV